MYSMSSAKNLATKAKALLTGSTVYFMSGAIPTEIKYNKLALLSPESANLYSECVGMSKVISKSLQDVVSITPTDTIAASKGWQHIGLVDKYCFIPPTLKLDNVGEPYASVGDTSKSHRCLNEIFSGTSISVRVDFTRISIELEHTEDFSLDGFLFTGTGGTSVIIQKWDGSQWIDIVSSTSYDIPFATTETAKKFRIQGVSGLYNCTGIYAYSNSTPIQIAAPLKITHAYIVPTGITVSWGDWNPETTGVPEYSPVMLVDVGESGSGAAMMISNTQVGAGDYIDILGFEFSIKELIS